MASHLGLVSRLNSLRRRSLRLIALVTVGVGLALAATAVAASGASATTVPPDPGFETVPTLWTTNADAGALSTISATQTSAGTNHFERTTYNALANLLGLPVAGLSARESIISHHFTWSGASPGTANYTIDERAQLGGITSGQGVTLTGVLVNYTTGTSTQIFQNSLTASSTTFQTITGTVSPSLLLNNDDYTLSVIESFAPTVALVETSTVDIDNVAINTTPTPPPAPVLGTGAGSPQITNITSTGATATATIDPGSTPTTVTVNYGTTTSYGNQVQQTIAANAGPTAISIPLSGLTPSTGYDADIVATNGGGLVTSGNLTFTTAMAQSAPSPAIGSGTISGTPDEHGATVQASIGTGGLATTYDVQYGTSTSYGAATSPQSIDAGGTDPHAASTTLSGLLPGTTYHARFVATGPGGTTNGGDFTFTTAAASPPTVTAGPSFATTGTSGNAVTAGVTVDPGSHDTAVAVNYGPTSSYGSVTAAITIPAGSGPTTVQIPITGLTPGSTYHAQVSATNADGTVLTADNTFTPTATTVAPSLAAGSAQITNVTSSGATATATIDPGTADATVTVNYGTTTGYGSQVTQTIAANSGPTTVSIPLSGLTPSTAYNADIVATNGGGSSGASGNLTFTTGPAQTTPAPAIGAGTVSGTPAERSVTLQAPISTGGLATTYDVQYGTSTSYGAATSPQSIDAGGTDPHAASTVLGTLQPGTTYHARFVATGPGGTTNGADITFTTAAATPPAITAGPTFVSSDAAGDAVIASVTVDPVGHDTTVSISYGATASHGLTTASQTVVAGSGPTTVQIPIAGLTAGSTYHAQVSAVSADGTAPASDVTFVPTATTTPPTIQTNSAAITNLTSSGATATATIDPGTADATVTVNYGTTTGYGSHVTQTIAANSGPTPVSVPISGLTAATAYDADIVVSSTAGPSATSGNLTFTTLAGQSTSAPTIGAGSASGTAAERSATLQAQITTFGQATSYYVQYGMDMTYGSVTSSQTINAGTGDPAAAAASLTGLLPGMTYHARFVAVGPGGTTDGGDFTFSTAAASIPSISGAPTFTASDTTGDAVTATVTVDPGSHDTTVSFSYGASSSYGFTTPSETIPAGSGPTVIQIPITGLTVGTTYHAQVNAINSDGTAPATDTTFTPVAAAVGTPTVFINPPAHTATVQANLGASPQGASYFVEYGLNTNYGSNTATQSVPPSATLVAATVPGLAPATTYHTRVVIQMANGSVSFGPDATFTTTSLPTVTGAGAIADSTTTSSVNATVDPGIEDTTVQVLYGTTAGYGQQSPTQTVPAGDQANVTFALGGLVPDTTYHAQVIATNRDGTETGSDVTFTTPSAVITTTTTTPTTSATPTTASPTTPTSTGGGGTTTTTGGGTSTTPVSGPGTASCVAAYVSGSPKALQMLKVAAAGQVTAGHQLRIAIAARAQLRGRASYRVARGAAVKTGRTGASITLSQLRTGHATAVHFVVPRKHGATLHLTITIHALACGTQVTETHPSPSAVALTVRSPAAARTATFTVPASWKSPTRLTVISATATRTVAVRATGGTLSLAKRTGAVTIVRHGRAITVAGLPAQATGVTLRFPVSGTTKNAPVTVRVVRAAGGAKTVHIGGR